jgi:DNA-binding CsgD family transcriptional regulator
MHIDNSQFSEREKEVIGLLLQGKSNKQIALALHISASTVEYHLRNVYKKLQVHSRTEAILRLGKSIGNEMSGEFGKSVVEKNSERADNGAKPISTRRTPMNKMYLILGGLLTTTLAVVLTLVNLPAQTAEVAPTAISSTLTEVPHQIVAETTTPVPLQIPLVVSPRSCASSNGQLPTLSNPEVPSLRPVKNTLGGGIVQSDGFTIELFLYCDAVFQHQSPDFVSDIDGLAIYYNWRYDAPDESGMIQGFFGIEPDVQWKLGLGPSTSQGYVSQGQSTGILFASNPPADFSEPPNLRFIYIMRTEAGHLSGAVLAFDIQQMSDGLQPSNIHLSAMSEAELASIKTTLPPASQ